MEISTKIKVMLGKALTEDQIKELKSYIVQLEDQLAPVDPNAPIAEPELPVMVKTKDGIDLSIQGGIKEGAIVQVVDVDGAMTSAQGEYVLETGEKITVLDGVIQSVESADSSSEPAPSSDVMPEVAMKAMETKMSAIEKSYEVKLSEQKTAFDNKLDNLSKIVLSQTKMIDALVNTPLDTIKMETVPAKSIDEMTALEFRRYQKEHESK